MIRGRWLDHPATVVTREFGTPGPYALGWHTGLDLAVPGKGKIPIVWAKPHAGLVSAVGWDSAYGHFVRVIDLSGDEYLFAHLSRVAVKPGVNVAPGTQIGLTGQSGNATGDHLHLERGIGRWRYGRVKRPELAAYSVHMM